MSCDLLKEIPLGLVNLIPLRATRRNLLVQLLQIRHTDIRYLLHDLHDHLELGTEYLVHLTAQRGQ